MLHLLGNPTSVCSGLNRREVLQVGGAGLFGTSLASVLQAEERRTAGVFQEARAKSVIFVFLFGGPSQLETFDMKPDAPAKLRGPFNPIAARTPDLRICELLPQLAAISDKYAIIRTMTHTHNDHNACHYIQTGHPWPRVAANGQDVNATELDWPSMGSVVEYLSLNTAGETDRKFPNHLYLPTRLGHLQGYDRTGQYAGWLGRAYNALATDIRKRGPKDNPFFRDCTDEELVYQIQGLLTGSEMSVDRLNRRSSLLSQFDDSRASLDRSQAYRAYDGIRQRALSLVTSEEIRTALDIRAESATVRDRYGRHLAGQSLLMSRRMIEAGARFVTMAWEAPDGYGWDSHITSDDLRKHLLPKLDQSLSALMDDLDQRGMLDETLVVVCGEMGRTPLPTGNGRGHWSFAFPCLLAGAGIQGGLLYGATDKDAGWPIEKPTSPEDLTATIFSALGIEQDERIHDRQGRPVSVAEKGRVLSELFV